MLCNMDTIIPTYNINIINYMVCTVYDIIIIINNTLYYYYAIRARIDILFSHEACCI